MRRRKSKILLIVILLMAIGFASITTALVLNGTINLMGDTTFDGDVVFVSAKTEENGSATISNDGKSITYTSKELSKIDDASTLNFEIANKNRQYDAVATINCNTTVSELGEYVRIEPNATEYTIEAGDTTSGNITSTLTKAYAVEDVEVAFTCNIVATASERETIGKEYVEPYLLHDKMKTEAVLDNKIDFSKVSSNTNGKGLYLLESTKDEEHPIYYYRGQVNDNNMKFANFCWKIVRTTSTGGTKLIYNGIPDENGYCTNTTGESTQIKTKSGQTTSAFNPERNSLAYNGYMYGTVYESRLINSDRITEILYGGHFEYNDALQEYTLKETDVFAKNDKHYTCLNSTENCKTIKYFHNKNGGIMYYIDLNDGKDVNVAIEEMQTNKKDSIIKEEIDNWYEENMTEYTKYLEDTIWCNDRSMNEEGTDESWINNGWKPNGGELIYILYNSAYGRIDKSYKPSIGCKNKNDSFTVDEKLGNGTLTYPVGLLTSDEVILAGGQKATNSLYYLYTKQAWWTMSPAGYFLGSVAAENAIFEVYGTGQLTTFISSYNGNGIRPSISLAPEIKINSGDGTPENPYTIKE